MFFNAFSFPVLGVFLLSASILEGQAVTIQADAERPAGVPFFLRVDEPEGRGGWVLENEDSGAVLPVQVYGTTQLVALLEAPMVAGESRTYHLRAGKEREVFAQGGVVASDGLLKMMVGQKEVLCYPIAEQFPADSLPAYYRRSGFIHPVRSPSGVAATDGFPVGHTHQHGIFMAWVNALFRGEKVDFWNQHRETGTVEHFAIDTWRRAFLIFPVTVFWCLMACRMSLPWSFFTGISERRLQEAWIDILLMGYCHYGKGA